MTKHFHGLMLVKRNSKRLPNKNTLPFHGKPMFMVNLEKCLKIFKQVYVSTDDSQIAKQAKDAGAIPIMRPASLCGDCPNIPVYQHALDFMEGGDGIVAVQANSPTISSETIKSIKELVEQGGRNEVMTCHPGGTIYGSVWALSRGKLVDYGDPYDPKPEVKIVDNSIDIHDNRDYQDALK